MHIIDARIRYALLCIGFAAGCGSSSLDDVVASDSEDLTVLWSDVASSCGCATLAWTPTASVRVRAGGDLQAAINAAQPGSEILLDAGATYTGNYTLPATGTTSYVTIGTYGTSASCTRVTPADAAGLAQIEAKGTLPAFQTAAGAHHWRLMNLEIRPPSGTYASTLVQLGTGIETDRTQLPHDIILDRLYVHGDPAKGGKRGVALNSGTTTVQNSWISDIKSTTQDSQAIAGWNGSGGWLIANNHLEAAGENMLIGGTDPTIPKLVPTSIKVKFNHFDKPVSWWPGDPSYAGTHWLVKNLFELKNAKSVTVEGNLFEHNWPDAQKGFSILFTPRNQDGTAPWSRVSYVTFRRNVVRHVAAAVNILGHDDIYPSLGTQYITIKDNLFEDVGGAWGGTTQMSGRLFQLVSGTNDPGPSYVTIDHNTGMQGSYWLLGVGGAGAVPKPGFVFTNSIVMNGNGVYGDGASGTASALSTNFPDATILDNAIINGASTTYSAYTGNYFPSSSTIGFKSTSDYELASSSSYNNIGTDGRDLGVYWYYLDQASQCY